MHDIDVRIALHERLQRTHRRELSSTRFVNELGVAGEVRIDLAVLNGAFSGYEIKSASDNLRRLPRQVQGYSKVLDYCTLVVASGHVVHAAALLPTWWGVIEAQSTPRGIRLRRVKPAQLNRQIDPWFLATLLWRDEALELLDRSGSAKGLRGKANHHLWERLVEVTPPKNLKADVRETLKARASWRVDG
ncbi:sce7726 family protein [Cryobacterium sp. SO1]|uniref:sce7726 family protein n=1 Tax=Cryobacterium sp. SO1 TaxID=1897061 RepID=UPI001023A546|nr:sce7726 family protein [Cryobacterium sp. SO1]